MYGSLENNKTITVFYRNYYINGHNHHAHIEKITFTQPPCT